MKTLILAIYCLLIPPYTFAFLNPPEFISLVPPDGYDILERENQLSKLCPEKDPVKAQKCRSENLKPQSWNLSLYDEPRKDAKIVGKLVITATPGKGMTAEYLQDHKKSTSVPSDSKQTDWGYSSYFEFTIKEKKGDWLQLPKRPFLKPVWINLNLAWPSKGTSLSPSQMETGTVYSAGALGDIVITRFSGSTFTYRKENENDNPCIEEPKNISSKELEEFTKPIETLFDSDGHLIPWIKYSRGC